MRSPPSLSNERIQIINEEKEFTKELGAQIGQWGLSDAGFQYNLVAILGSQSTGKSTLLNKLFGTTFDVMDPTRRRQTTKGHVSRPYCLVAASLSRNRGYRVTRRCPGSLHRIGCVSWQRDLPHPLTNAPTMRNPPSLMNVPIQIVNENQEFTKGLGAQIGRWGLGDAGFQYNLVAVLGSQSTGKSTLLNKLFGTKFDVMNEAERRQTTKGIWMCRGDNMNIMVMDVEGTDGREHGEDQDFERKSALFTLASSEVLIVNLWEHQVGLYQGANMGLLKTVFAVHLSLFGKSKGANGSSPKTMLLFVIRDYQGVTPLSNLSASLTTDMQKIWDEVSKQQNPQYGRLTDHFDLEFTALSPKRWLPEKFDEEVTTLRGRFVDGTREDYVFKAASHRRIPADGVAHYMESIWEQVQSNKDLDLPTQQELLAHFRCDEIAALALREFDTEIKSLQKSVENGGIIEGLGGMMEGRRSSTLARFDQDALRYHPEVYRRKRAELFAQLNTRLHFLFVSQVKTLRSSCGNSFKQELLEGVKIEGCSFANVVDGAHKKWDERFRKVAAEALLPDTDWSYDEDLKLLKQEFKNITDQLVIEKLERTFHQSLTAPAEEHLKKPKMDMWDRLLEEFRNILSAAEETYLTETKPLNCTDSANEAALKRLRKHAWRALRTKITEQTDESVLVSTLHAHFKEQFRYDTTASANEVTRVFELAKDDTLIYIPIYAEIAPQTLFLRSTLIFDIEDDALTDEDDVDSQSFLIILSSLKQEEILTQVLQRINATYKEAMDKIKSRSQQLLEWGCGALAIGAGVYRGNPVAVGVVAGSIVARTPQAQSVLSTCSETSRRAAFRVLEYFRPSAAETDKPGTRPKNNVY